MIEEKDYLIGDMRLHAEVSGSGSPLILMHGWGCYRKVCCRHSRKNPQGI